MNLIDCHTHTQFSVDSEAGINKMVKRAEELELAAYAITDHCECNFWYEPTHYGNLSSIRFFNENEEHCCNFQNDFENSISAVTKLKEEYSDKLNLICGTELGQATHDIEIAEKIVSDKRLDFVIGSVHQLRNTEDFAFLDYADFTDDELYDLLWQYFNEIYELCQWGKFDILAHLTYTLRYMQGIGGRNLSIKRFDEIIAESFRLLIQKGKGIEINTSGLRQAYGFTFPKAEYIKLYHDLGGEILSIGSDAHTVEDLGKGIADGAQIALQCGFRYLCYFKNREPVFVRI